MVQRSISWLTTFDRKQELDSISTQYTQFFEIGNFTLIAFKEKAQARYKEAKMLTTFSFEANFTSFILQLLNVQTKMFYFFSFPYI